MTPNTAPAPNTAVTTSVTRRIPHGSEHDFLTWTERGIALAQRYPGFLGGGWLRSPTDPDHYHIVYRFRSHHDLDRWLTSGDRRSWAEGAPHTATDTTTTRLTGVEGWFDHRPAHAPVPRWKQTTTIWLGFCPLSLLLNYLLVPHLAAWHVIPRTIVVSTLCTPAMTYLVLPVLTRRLKPWLTATPKS